MHERQELHRGLDGNKFVIHEIKLHDLPTVITEARVPLLRVPVMSCNGDDLPLTIGTVRISQDSDRRYCVTSSDGFSGSSSLYHVIVTGGQLHA